MIRQTVAGVFEASPWLVGMNNVNHEQPAQEPGSLNVPSTANIIRTNRN
jgi:hypothetical protein